MIEVEPMTIKLSKIGVRARSEWINFVQQQPRDLRLIESRPLTLQRRNVCPTLGNITEDFLSRREGLSHGNTDLAFVHKCRSPIFAKATEICTRHGGSTPGLILRLGGTSARLHSLSWQDAQPEDGLTEFQILNSETRASFCN